MTKKILSGALVLAVAVGGILLFRHPAAKVEWTTYDGTLARINLPAGWKVHEKDDEKIRFIDLKSKTKEGGLVFFTLVKHEPTAEIADIGHFIKHSIDGSPKPHPIVVKQTTVGDLAAKEFTTYMPKPFVHNYDATGVDVIHATFTEERNIVFACGKGEICEIVYDVPETKDGNYEDIFRKIVDSIRLK